MARARVAVIGVGFIGEEHLKALHGHGQFEIVGICDQSPALAAARSQQFSVPVYDDHTALLEQARPDYVTICTPHYSHASIAIDAMSRGAHALVEKPFTVSASAAEECIDVMDRTGMTMGVGFVMRLHPAHRRMRQLIEAGFLGDVVRVTFVRTNWFRSMAYYNSNPWRGTWKGEGGGIIVNQAPHDLDLIFWTAGSPAEVLVEMNTSGHDIEVEDDVCALLKWPSGATGVFHVSTNEAPGRSFYEIAGTKGTLLLEDGRVRATELTVDSRDFSETTTERMEPPPVAQSVTYDEPERDNPFVLLHENFASAIAGDATLVCSAQEALHEVQLANAMLLSGVGRQWTPVPAESEAFDSTLQGLIEAGSLREYKRRQG